MWLRVRPELLTTVPLKAIRARALRITRPWPLSTNARTWLRLTMPWPLLDRATTTLSLLHQRCYDIAPAENKASGIYVKCCPDTGATKTVIHERIARQAGLVLKPPQIGMNSSTGPMDIVGEAKVVLKFDGLKLRSWTCSTGPLDGLSPFRTRNQALQAQVLISRCLSPVLCFPGQVAPYSHRVDFSARGLPATRIFPVWASPTALPAVSPGCLLRWAPAFQPVLVSWLWEGPSVQGPSSIPGPCPAGVQGATFYRG